MKRSDISGLKGNYLMRFQIGIIVALATCLAAFNFTTYPVKGEEVILTLVNEIEDDIPITHYPKEKPKELPPPRIEVSEIIMPAENIEFIEKKPMELIEKVVEANVKKVFVAPKPKAFKAIPKPEILEPEIIEPPVDEIKTFVDEMPRFDACEDMEGSKKEKQDCANQALIAHVANKIKYPNIARENNIKGTVVIQFVVEKDGSITQVNVVRDIGGGCGAEALRVIKELPTWIPGKQRSRPVRVKFTLPIKFDFL